MLRRLFSAVFILATVSVASAQGINKDNGHAAIGNMTVFANWNAEAGRDIPDDFSTYPEFLPNLRGWDFRINLPYVRYKLASQGSIAPVSMVGVVEGPSNVDTITAYGHRNNSIWLFQVDANGHVLYKILPSSRNLNGPGTRNVRSLTAGWKQVGSAPSPSTPPFAAEAIAAAVVGEGIGTARIFVVARAATGALYINKLLVNNEDPVWPGSWTALGRTSTEGASLVGAFGNKVAMAWTAAGTNHVKLSLLTPANGTWSPPIDVAAGRAAAPLGWKWPAPPVRRSADPGAPPRLGDPSDAPDAISHQLGLAADCGQECAVPRDGSQRAYSCRPAPRRWFEQRISHFLYKIDDACRPSLNLVHSIGDRHHHVQCSASRGDTAPNFRRRHGSQGTHRVLSP
jgi:hypothetical protein